MTNEGLVHGNTEAGPAEDYFHEYLHRTILLLGRDAVDTLRTKTVAIAGCGGHGGAAALTLARMGVGGFILSDPKPFDEPDINRQWGATRETLGQNKARVYGALLRDINPDVSVRLFEDGVTDQNVATFLDQADFLVDCLDVAVPGALRAKVFAAARARAIYAATGANLGFGGLVATAAPDGPSMELLGAFEDDAMRDAGLPSRFREILVPEYLTKVEDALKFHRVPSVAVAPALLGTLLSVEAILALLGATIPGWRPPICLPHFLLVDMVRMNYRVVHVDECLANPVSPATCPDAVSPSESCAVAATPQERQSLLSQSGYSTNLLPDRTVVVDLLTDSWNEIGWVDNLAGKSPAEPPMASPEELLRGFFGYRHFVPVFRGRFAEALLARSVAVSRGIVVSNGLFPSTRFHLESNGFTVLELRTPQSYDLHGEFPFNGNLDLEALRQLLSGPTGPQVKAVYVELCANASGGHPVSVANLRAVRELTSPLGIRVLLDPTRAFENAALIQQREPGYADKPLVAIVRELCSYSDACATSCAKDFKCTVGGFVATNDDELFTGLRDLTLAFGDGLTADSRATLSRALICFPLWNRRSAERVAQVGRLWQALRQLSVPVVAPAGGHGVFVDVRALLPHLPVEQFPAQALANELFVAAGVRAAANLASPEQERRGIHLLRLAVPIDRYSDNELQRVVTGFETVMANRGKIRGLVRAGGPAGAGGEFEARYAPAAEKHGGGA